jgi:hypothetical protein
MSRARRFADKGNLHSLVLNATDGSATDAGEKVLLDGTDTSASNAGFTILLEDATGNADVRITSQLDNGVFNFTSVPKNDNNPAFFVTTLTNDNNAENAYSKLLFDVVHFDVGGYYDRTNYWYNPKVPGYYHFYAQYQDVTGTDVYDLICSMWKGSGAGTGSTTVAGQLTSFSRQRNTGITGFDFYASTVDNEVVTYMNGDDDFIQVMSFGLSAQGSTVTVYGDGRSTFFGGQLISRQDSGDSIFQLRGEYNAFT